MSGQGPAIASQKNRPRTLPGAADRLTGPVSETNPSRSRPRLVRKLLRILGLAANLAVQSSWDESCWSRGPMWMARCTRCGHRMMRGVSRTAGKTPGLVRSPVHTDGFQLQPDPMRIVASALDLQSQASQTRAASQQTEINHWVGERPAPSSDAVVEVSQAARQLAQQAETTAANATSELSEGEESAKEPLDPRLLLLIALVERLTGRRVELLEPGELQGDQAEPVAVTAESANSATSQEQGWGLEIKVSRTVVESESTSFQAQGAVLTADGRRIAFDARYSWEHEQVTIENFEFRAGDAARPKDPLALSFTDQAPQWTGQRSPLDLDQDGKLESLPSLSGESAWLVNDRNANGVVDGGAELFGPSSGDGFSELAALDQDQNGWIDEGDAAFTRLRVWFSGSSKLLSLADAGVGALFVGSTATPFRLRDAAGNVAGAVRATGVWLAESGDVHGLSQVDVLT